MASSAAAEADIDHLAARLKGDHGDPWLTDLLAARRDPKFSSAASLLSQSIVENNEGVHASAAGKAQNAKALFEAMNSPAGALRSGIEEVYSLHRLLQGEKCLAATRPLLLRLQGLNYRWAEAHLLTEQSICFAMTGAIGPAHDALRRGMKISEQSHYPSLYLRALGISASNETAIGNAQGAWALDSQGLGLYFAGQYPPVRGYQFYSDLSFAAERADQFRTALATAREATAMLANYDNDSVKAMAHYRVAMLSTVAGTRREAEDEFERARQLFASAGAKGSGAPSIYQVSSEIGLATLQAKHGDTEKAMQSLSKLGSNLSGIVDFVIPLRLHRTLGTLHLDRGDLDQAHREFSRAVEIAETGLPSLRGDRQWAAWDLETGKAYRGLVEIAVRRKQTPQQVLALWEWYRAAPLRADTAKPRHAQTDVPASRPNTVVVSYAQISTGLLVFVVDAKGVEFKQVALTNENLESVSRRFITACATRNSSLAGLQRDARQLYDWMLAPVDARLRDAPTVIIEPDGALSGIPMQALMDSNGTYFGARHQIVSSPGLWYGNTQARSRPFTAADRVLVVGAPALSPEMAASFPPLTGAEDEARNVAARFRTPQIFTGANATVDVFRRELPKARVLHFSGHGFDGPDGPALLLAASPVTGVDTLTASGLRRDDIGLCRLAVLAACATATGEKTGVVNPDSLVSAFLRAGVRHVVAARWNVDSTATAALIGKFYSGLLSGASVAQSLRTATEQIRATHDMSHPYYWAAFNTFGTE
jgi:CHAT domain-containing protein